MVSIIIPTYNEIEGITPLVEAIFQILSVARMEGEVVIVDDNSPDGTGAMAEELGKRFRMKVVHRSGKLGLSSAVVEGFNAAEGEILGVMDADFSHDPEAIPALVRAITDEGVDLAIGSRYVPGGGIRNWSISRRIISRVAVLLGRPLTKIRDITSGYFFLRREVVEGVKLNPIGFKIGLEVFVKGKHKKWKEVPYTFVDRRSGKSKMDQREVLNYLRQLVDLARYRMAGGQVSR